MACAIALDKSRTWFAKNTLYGWFVEVILASNPDQDVAEELRVSDDVGGLDLSRLHQLDPELASRTAAVLAHFAARVATGELVPPTGSARVREHFATLVTLLDTWDVGPG